MSTKREPLLSDKDISKSALIQCDASMAVNGHDFAAGERSRGYASGAIDARDIYEAARQKDAELIQALVDKIGEVLWDAENCDWTCDACGTDYGMRKTDLYSSAKDAIATAEAAGFKPTQP